MPTDKISGLSSTLVLSYRLSCGLPPAVCLLPSASCRLPPAVCFLPSASCRLPPAVCFLPLIARQSLDQMIHPQPKTPAMVIEDDRKRNANHEQDGEGDLLVKVG